MVVVVMLVSTAGLADAQQMTKEEGVDSFVFEGRVLELDEGHSITLSFGQGVEVAADPSMPTHMSAIDCAGIIENFPDKTYKGNGYCTLTAADGSKLFQRWQEGTDMAEGRYETFGGTGKFEGAKGEGTYTVGEIPQGRGVSMWKGTTEYPNLSKSLTTRSPPD
jgi:hypothetical protein